MPKKDTGTSQWNDKMKKWTGTTNSIFTKYKRYCLDYDDKDKRRIFIDRGSKVLMIAHVDTVVRARLDKPKKGRLRGSGFDDRLGCLIAFDLSKELGCDLLLTDNEESGNSTAQYHECRDYNWVVEFDRAGNDVVTYDLDNKTFVTDIENNGWKVGIGAFSDICFLETKACCLNVGIGYEHAHSTDSYAVVSTIEKQIEKFKYFFAAHRKTEYIVDNLNAQRMTEPFFYNKYNGEDDNYCELCGYEPGTKVHGMIICRDCFEYIMYQHI
jgi:hypothetical protein